MNPIFQHARLGLAAAWRIRWLRLALALGLGSAVLSGCYYYDPYYGPYDDGPYYAPAPVVAPAPSVYIGPTIWWGGRYWRGYRHGRRHGYHRRRHH